MKIFGFQQFNESKKGLKGKDPYVFVRYGSIDLVRQSGYKSDPGPITWDNKHAPPAPRGFYAMPKIAQEQFLVSQLDISQPRIFGKKKYTHKEYKNKLRSIRKEFRKNKGNVWHHLKEYCDAGAIIDQHGTWVKTSLADWAKAFSKYSTVARFGRRENDLRAGYNVVYPGKGITGGSKDWCEVFFDEKI